VTTTSRRCNACGMTGCERETCNFVKKSHPDIKACGGPWTDSANGKAWKALGYDSIQWTMKSIEDSPSQYIPLSPTLKKAPNGEKTSSRKRLWNKSEQYILALHDKHKKLKAIKATPVEMTNFIISSFITVHSQSKELGAFFNTGALSSNYISVELAAWLIQNGVKLCRCSRTICSSVARCAKSTGMLDFDFDFTLINEITLINASIILTARILNSEYDLIIGLPTLRQYNLLQAFTYKFNAESNIYSGLYPTRINHTTLR